MDLLGTAVVDIAMLVATSRALRTRPLQGELAAHGKLPSKLRDELRRGTAAYIDALARSKRGEMDGQLLEACRCAAEMEMPRATKYREELSRLMSSAPGVLSGIAAMRQDLWRLAHIVIHIRIGLLAIREASDPVEFEAAKKLAGRLRRRVRRALIAYARASHREWSGAEPMLIAARSAAVKQIGRQAEADAERLSEVKTRENSSTVNLQTGVTRPLHDLMLDWRRASEDSAVAVSAKA